MPKLKNIAAVAFVGKQNSGKTTLLVKLVAELSGRGVRVGTVKHHSHVGFEFDIEGKDSWRHRQAGSVHTVIAAPDQIASVRSLASEVSLEQILNEMRCSSRNEDGEPLLDVILVEGYRHGGIPTVELFRANNPNDENRELGCEGNNIVAVATDMQRIKDAAAQNGLAVYDIDDFFGLADFVQDNFC